MTIKFGFELELFAVDAAKNDEVVLPPKGLPTDGFPGLIEIRTVGGHDLAEAVGKLSAEELRMGISPFKSYKDTTIRTSYMKFEHKFTGEHLNQLRKRYTPPKDPVPICNIYGKSPCNSNGKTLAAFQINMSNELSHSFTGKDGFVPAKYGLLDVFNIVKALDLEFKSIIESTNRQPGMYCIKDNIRLEYRSLPNCVMSVIGIDNIYDKIIAAFKTLDIKVS